MISKKYSLKKNLRYMGYCYSKPKKLIKELISESIKFIYIILPFTIFTAGYEILFIRGFLLHEALIPLPKIFPLTDSQYQLLEIFIFPIVHFCCFVVSMAVIYAFSRIYENKNIDTVKISFFYVLVGNTIGLLALVVDIIALFIQWDYWMFIHPISVIIYGIYLVYFIQELSGIRKLQASLITIVSLIAFFSFRILFIR